MFKNPKTVSPPNVLTSGKIVPWNKIIATIQVQLNILVILIAIAQPDMDAQPPETLPKMTPQLENVQLMHLIQNVNSWLI